MFEKIARTTTEVLYWSAIAIGVAGLAWACFAHLPFIWAMLLFPVALSLAAMVGGPLAAGASLIAGLVVASTAVVIRSLASIRSGA